MEGIEQKKPSGKLCKLKCPGASCGTCGGSLGTEYDNLGIAQGLLWEGLREGFLVEEGRDPGDPRGTSMQSVLISDFPVVHPHMCVDHPCVIQTQQ